MRGLRGFPIPDFRHLISDRFLRLCVTGSQAIKYEKSIWWMPWHREAMKDVARCDKLRGVVSKL